MIAGGSAGESTAVEIVAAGAGRTSWRRVSRHVHRPAAPCDDQRCIRHGGHRGVPTRLLTRTTALTTPLKPLEAMAMGRAVVSSDVPAMRELVRDGETGVTFPAGRHEGAGAGCLRLLEDPALRRALGAARSRVGARTPSMGQPRRPLPRHLRAARGADIVRGTEPSRDRALRPRRCRCEGDACS